MEYKLKLEKHIPAYKISGTLEPRLQLLSSLCQCLLFGYMGQQDINTCLPMQPQLQPMDPLPFTVTSATDIEPVLASVFCKIDRFLWFYFVCTPFPFIDVCITPSLIFFSNFLC
ncbi:uncharacterized protein LOC124777520 [Schistocerca piceifrons]|uniref:uncharacterized protein LOC124777520 n=1 Tax=Schistocerca piceifrons TaxID=274613 RepID=UPI001F5F6333|nr:uncharacterized protein LOC124777520 [Schistocerca piceifrons]